MDGHCPLTLLFAMQDDNDRHQQQETPAAGGLRPAGLQSDEPQHSVAVIKEEGQTPLVPEETEAPRVPLASPENSYRLLGSPFTRGSPLDGGSLAGSPGYNESADGFLTTVPEAAAAGAEEEAAAGAEEEAAAGAEEEAAAGAEEEAAAEARTAAGTEEGAAAPGLPQNRSDGLTTTTLVLSVLPILCLPSDAAGEVAHLFDNMVAQVAAATAGRRAAMEATQPSAASAAEGPQPAHHPCPPPVGGTGLDDLGAPHGGRSLPDSPQPPG